MRRHGLFLLIATLLCSVAAAQTLEVAAAPSVWTPTPRWSAGFAVQPQMVGPSALAELSDRQPLLHASSSQASVLVVGASLRTGPRSALSLQTPVATGTPFGARADASQMQLAWSLRARDPAKQWFGGGSPLKMALSGGQTVITLKPRASRVSVTVQHRW